MDERFNALFGPLEPAFSTARSRGAAPRYTEESVEEDSESGEDDDASDTDECTSLSEDSEHYDTELQARRRHHWSASPSDDSDDDTPPTLSASASKKIPRLPSGYAATSHEAERRAQLRREQEQFRREADAFAASVRERGGTLEVDAALEDRIDRVRLREQRLRCEEQLRRLEADHTLGPAEIVRACQECMVEITDYAVLQRLTRHLDAPRLSVMQSRGELVVYSADTELYYILVGLQASHVLFYCKIAKQTLAPF